VKQPQTQPDGRPCVLRGVMALRVRQMIILPVARADLFGLLQQMAERPAPV
jgi:hypothetical protein